MLNASDAAEFSEMCHILVIDVERTYSLTAYFRLGG